METNFNTSMMALCSCIMAMQAPTSCHDIGNFLTECSKLFMLARQCFKQADAASGDFPIPDQMPQLDMYRAKQPAKPGVPMIKLLDQGLMFGRFVVATQFLQVLLPDVPDDPHHLGYLVVTCAWVHSSWKWELCNCQQLAMPKPRKP